MNGRVLGILFVAAVAGLLLLARNSRQQPEVNAQPAAQAKQWEYKLVKIEKKWDEVDLNKLGAEGWEHSGGYEITGFVLFKRPKR
jgi:hypothetical protein